jgi:hypothetical protein
VWAVKRGFISVTPVMLDSTDYDFLKKAKRLSLDGI